MTAYNVRLHSGKGLSGLSGSPPSEPFNSLNRATRFIICARVQGRMFFQVSIRRAPSSRQGRYYERREAPLHDVKIRSQLYLLVAGALAPMIVFALAAALLLLRHERESLERDAGGRARAAMSAVDA